MAYLPYDQEDPLLQAKPVGSGAPSSGPSGGSSAGQVGVAPQTQADSGSSYANLTAYLNANAPQGRAMGQAVADQIGQDATAATAQHVPTTYWWVPGQPRVNPQGMIQELDESFQGSYTPDQVQQAKNLQQEIGATGTAEGRQAILDQRYGTGGSNQGGRQLDSLLMGTYGMAPIQDASAQWSSPLAGVAGYTYTKPPVDQTQMQPKTPRQPSTLPEQKPAPSRPHPAPPAFVANGGPLGYGGSYPPGEQTPKVAANSGASGYGIEGVQNNRRRDYGY